MHGPFGVLVCTYCDDVSDSIGDVMRMEEIHDDT